MKKYIYIGAISLFAILAFVVGIQTKELNNYKNRLAQTESSLRAYAQENSTLKGSNREFQLTIDDLNNSNDSLMIKLNDTRKQLKVKDKEIKRLGYIASTAHKSDTIRLRDTLFRDAKVNIDTTITDKDGWYKCDVGLYYPNKVKIAPTFKSEKSIIASLKKETVGPPKKCWLARLFQKKQNVVTVDVVENNPFIVSDKKRFIEIVK